MPLPNELSHFPVRILKRILDPINRLFDWLYHSEYNPLYRSGTLAVGLLAILLITGLYLIFFFSVGTPYESLENIQGQYLLGRWIRAVHRYASDLALIAIIFHVIQLLLQSKTWGPRILAWLSGIILVGFLFLSVYSGYVMVWDKHGEMLAIAGAKLLSVFPFLKSALGQAFSGAIPIPESFFFVNLFLHVALPLIMIFGMWVHTARLSRSKWFPEKEITIWTTVGLILLGVLWPAPLVERSDLLRIGGEVPIDLFYAFIIPVADRAPLLLWVVTLVIAILVSSMPWWWRPKQLLSKSKVREDLCSGCTQCVDDCPYEAIRMIPRSDGKRLLAEVTPELCVSCGICSTSCNDLAIGPPGRSGQDGLNQVDQILSTYEPGLNKIIVINCIRTNKLTERVKAAFQDQLHLIEYDCCGTCHTQVLEKLLLSYGGVAFIGCPERNCMNRDGFELFRQRMFEKRVPFLDRSIDKGRIKVIARSVTEVNEAIAELRSFQRSILNALKAPAGSKVSQSVVSSHSKARFIVSRTISTTVILLGIAWLSQFKIGEPPTTGILRVTGVLPAQAKEACRALTETEKSSIPKHMQKKEICETRSLKYRLAINVDQIKEDITTHSSSSARGDTPIFINQEIALAPGPHRIEVKVGEIDGANVKSHPLDQVEILKGEVKLIDLSRLYY